MGYTFTDAMYRKIMSTPVWTWSLNTNLSARMLTLAQVESNFSETGDERRLLAKHIVGAVNDAPVWVAITRTTPAYVVDDDVDTDVRDSHLESVQSKLRTMGAHELKKCLRCLHDNDELIDHMTGRPFSKVLFRGLLWTDVSSAAKYLRSRYSDAPEAKENDTPRSYIRRVLETLRSTRTNWVEIFSYRMRSFTPRERGLLFLGIEEWDAEFEEVLFVDTRKLVRRHFTRSILAQNTGWVESLFQYHLGPTENDENEMDTGVLRDLLEARADKNPLEDGPLKVSDDDTGKALQALDGSEDQYDSYHLNYIEQCKYPENTVRRFFASCDPQGCEERDVSFQGTGTTQCVPHHRYVRSEHQNFYRDYYTNQVTWNTLRDMQPENFRYLLLETLIRMDEQRRGRPTSLDGDLPTRMDAMMTDEPYEIKVVSYNISWAVGENKVDGSERTFIEENDCVPNGSCRRRQMTSLQELKKEHGLDVLCLQEFRWHRDALLFPNVTLESVVNGSSVAYVRKGEVLIAWNKDKLGRQVEVIHTQLDRRDVTNPYRDCCTVLTEYGYVITNVHMPHAHEVSERKEMLTTHLSATLRSWRGRWVFVIVCGDFNDGGETSLLPLRLLDDEFELQPTSVDLRTCCYDREYGMDEERRYKLKGDYILSNMTSAGPLRTFDVNGQLHDHVTVIDRTTARSDHAPVYVTLRAPR